MTIRPRQQDLAANAALIVLLVVAFIAGIPPLVEVVVQATTQSSTDVTRVCRICGVVEDVREVTLESTQPGNASLSGDGFAMLFAVLKGKLPEAPVKVYDVEVHLEDGSVRVVREGTPPAWKPGDHVKVVTGKVRPVL